MPPKKVADKRVRKLIKPPLKIPSKITVKIGSFGTKPPKTEKIVSSERQLELANEVALAQLQAQSAIRKTHISAGLPTTQANNQETVKKPMKKFTSATTDVDSLEDFETTPEPKKIKRPGPKSKTILKNKKTPNLNPLVLVRNKQWEVKKKGEIAKPIAKVKNTPKRKKQLKSDAVNLGEVLSEAETTQACINIAATPSAKPRGRPKGSVKKPEKIPATSKTFTAKEIKAAASMLEHALGIASQPQSRPNSVISNRSNLSWTRDISTESSFSSGTTCINATTNDFIRFNRKLPLVQVENCAPPKVKNVTSTRLPLSELPKANSVTTHRLPPSVLSKDGSSSSDSESSSSSSSSSDSELVGTDTMPELILSTSSLTSRLPISDINTGQHIENIKNALKNLHSDIRKFVSHDDNDTCTYSEIYECLDRELKAIPPVRKGIDPDFDAIIDKCDNFDSDLEALLQETYSPEKSVEHRRKAGFTEQNEPKNKDEEEIEDSRRPSYEGNHDIFDRDLEASFQETYSPEKTVEHRRIADGLADQNESGNKDEDEIEDSRRPSHEDNRFRSSSPERCRLRKKNVHSDSEAIFAKPCLGTRESAANSQDTSTNLLDNQLPSNLNRVEASPTDSFKTYTSDNYNYVPFDRSDNADDDDDDALSLFAESISGMESLRIDPVASVTNVSLHDVYIPKHSPTSRMRQKYIYRPTKIQAHRSNDAEESIEEGEIISTKDNLEQEPDTKPKLLRAIDSSSGTRDKKRALMVLEDSNHLSSHTEEPFKRTEAQISSQPTQLFASYSSIKNPVKSSLYRGFCFFNIASQCKNASCRFPHVSIDANTFKCRLASLSEDNLISEYLLMRRYGSLKRNFCILFVEECKRRTATRILFEMAIEIGLEIVETDEDIRVKVLETTLLHLNTISLDECEDLLKFEYKGTMMCDVLLSCMANSQNFAQFKRAFVKLANLLRELKRPVDIQVASSILERVCILPGEDFLARGMLTLMENTDVSIFESSLACSFEVQLSNIDSNVRDVYLLTKKAALVGSLAQLEEFHPSTPPLMPHREEAWHPSPDTTNVDKLSETKETVFTRTINGEALRNLFKPPAKPVPKPFVIPRMSQSFRHGQNASGSRRGRIANRTPGGRWVVGSQMVRRNVMRK